MEIIDGYYVYYIWLPFSPLAMAILLIYPVYVAVRFVWRLIPFVGG